MVVALLAVLKAGGAYVPLDPAYPPERLALHARGQRRRRCWSTQRVAARIGCRDAARHRRADRRGREPRSAEHPTSRRATSARAGEPGVRDLHLRLHRAAQGRAWSSTAAWSTCSLDARARRPDGRRRRRAAVDAASRFDIARAGAASGRCSTAAALVHAPSRGARDPASCWRRRSPRRRGHARCSARPSTCGDADRRARPAGAAGPRCVIAAAARRCPRELATRLTARCRARAAQHVRPDRGAPSGAPTSRGATPDERAVPIGRPIANTQVYVLDAALAAGAGGRAGRAVHRRRGRGARLPGPARADGRAVRAGPVRREPGARLYRTGDLARWRADGRSSTWAASTTR